MDDVKSMAKEIMVEKESMLKSLDVTLLPKKGFGERSLEA